MSDAYRPPAGPPPGYGGPPRYDDSKQAGSNPGYAPPPGPPPGYAPHESGKIDNSDAKVSSGPSDEGEAQPPPYADWMQVPDNSLLPPPPSFGYNESPTANASADAAQQAIRWCKSNPMYMPRPLSSQQSQQINRGGLSMLAPNNCYSIRNSGSGTCHLRTSSKCQDSLAVSNLPLYAAKHHDPRYTGVTKTIYYEIRVISLGDTRRSNVDSGIAIGFVAPPYPAWRLCGWQRGSLSVMSDDGRRYVVNDRGGKDFTQPFRAGQVIGLGMEFRSPTNNDNTNRVSVFFTRNGHETGRWNLHEERDTEEEGDVDGLDGSRDLLAAVGVFGQVEIEVSFHDTLWRPKPER